jgi:hypothetical protein
MPGRIGLVHMLALVVMASLAGAVLADDDDEDENRLCPEGFNEIRNAGFSLADVGCTLCTSESCSDVGCLIAPPCVCPPGPELESCCEESPCCENCPEPKPLKCSFTTCECTPDECCFTICPKAAAPTVTPYGLVALGLLLAGLGLHRLRRRLGG